MHLRKFGAALAAISACAIVVFAADSPFNGTWKLNLAKSQMSGQTLTITKTAIAGVMHFDMQGFGYDFDATGKEFPTPDGGTSAWKQVNATTWDAVNKANGKVVATYHIVVNGDAMTVVMKATPPGGSPVEQNMSAKRASGGPGILGVWKTGETKGAATSLAIAIDATNGIKLSYPEFQISCTGKFDGKDYPIVGAGANLKQSLVFEKINATSFKMTTKIDGKPFYVDTFVISADGKTLTDNGMPVNANEPIKSVYEK